MNAHEEEFHSRGYIVVRNKLPHSVVQEWSHLFAHPSFLQSIFQIMYENHHISHPSPTIVTTPTGTSTDKSHNGLGTADGISTSQNPSTATAIDLFQRDIVTNSSEKNSNADAIQYTMSGGVKHGYREIVMRNPGRYEIALLALFDATSDENNKMQMRRYFPNHAAPDELISSIIQTIQSFLSFVPNLLNQQQPSSPCNGNDNKNNKNTESLAAEVAHLRNQSELSPQQCYTWSNVKIINISIIVSTPGSNDQAWHADGGHVDIEQHLPCHCCNIFVPLTAITEQNGPTEFRPGSHYYTRHLTKMMLLAKARNELQPIAAPIVSSLGDIIIFDYRILHRGRGNNNMNHQQTCVASGATNEPSLMCVNRTGPHSKIHVEHFHRENDGNTSNDRVILVITVSLPWFRDVLNFPKSNSIYDAACHDTVNN